ncbi:hypothetical protein ACIGXM_29765 [Kitasatospora sp. NPDC052896]|uniref:hypothetical protein n=1 Tax=Kitasatospora sp. NPDC052896 TaxID=3364061 RepID=UPI0037CAF665
MTRYCVDPDRNELAATWGTGEGDLTSRIATAPAGTDTATLLRLARALTQLSEAAWHTYTHPASAAGSLEPNSEGWRREQERQAFGEAAEAITRPNLPQAGSVFVSYSPLVESAHQVGRALHVLDSPDLTKAVLAETTTELAAVESAELGHLTDRAQQAVLLSREDASPAQVAAADHLLEQDPFGPAALFTDVDPTAASVAAAHWLAAAAEVAAEASGQNPTTVVLEADDIEALPHETPTLVLELLDSGATPNDAVTTLIRHAMHVADGLLPDPTALREQLDDFEETLAEYTDGDEEPDIEDAALRLTPLDPKRPARDLLEDLLTGIHGCWLLHNEYDELNDDEKNSTENDEEREAEANQHHSRARFAQLVRAAAARNHNRLI